MTTKKGFENSGWEVLSQLYDYCKLQNWTGYDPYDGLNGNGVVHKIMRSNPATRLFLIQLCKRSPINLRKILRIQPGQNAKGLGLLVSSALRLYRYTKNNQYREDADRLISLLLDQSIAGYSGHCWGYYFDWQSRVFFLPKFTPNIVVTTFVAQAFLDAFEILDDQIYFDIARSSCDFILHDLNKRVENGKVELSYSPIDSSSIYNAALLGAALLSRTYAISREGELKEFAQKVVEYIISTQNPDGSWYYGTNWSQKWIDNYHMGFTLEALSDCIEFLHLDHYKSHLMKGLSFYLNEMFVDGKVPKFYKNSLYPIEPHCSAQAILLFVKLSRKYGQEYKDTAKTILEWTIQHFYSPNSYFYFQKYRFYTNRIPYMRWVQAWMLRAMTEFEVTE